MGIYDVGIKRWKYVYLVFLLGMEAMTLVFPMLLQLVVESIQQGVEDYRAPGSTITSGEVMGSMFMWAGIVFGFILVVLFIHIITEFILSKYINKYAAAYRTNLFNKFQRVSSETIERLGASKVVPYILSDANWIRMVRRRTLQAWIFVPFTIFGSIGMMFFLSWQYSLIALAAVPFVALFYWYNYRKMAKIFPASVEAIDDYFLNVKEGITGARDIRILGKAEERNVEFAKHVNAKRQQHFNVDMRVAFSSSFTMILFTLITIAIIIFGINVNMQVAHDLVILNTVLQYLVRVQTGSHNLYVWFSDLLPRYRITKKRMQTVLDLPETDNAGGLKMVPNLAEPRLEMVNVQYQQSGRVGLALNINIPFNNRVAIAGGKGSRKSHIWKMLLREVELTDGYIAINGIDISSVNVGVIRKQMFSYCDSDAVFVKGTIRDNMRMLAPLVTDDEILQMFEEIGAHDFVKKFKGNFLDYQLDPRKTLSDATRNLLNIVRTALKPASIYIFDQCFEHINREYVAKFMAVLKKRRMTCLLITTDNIVCKAANKVYVLKSGRIIAEGKHAQLLDKNLEYKKFYASTIGQVAKQENLEQVVPVEVDVVTGVETVEGGTIV